MSQRFTASKSTRVQLLYKCSHCSNFVVTPVNISVQTTYHEPEFHTRQGMEKLHERKSAQLSEDLQYNVRGLLGNCDIDSIIDANLAEMPCPHCKKHEPWNMFSMRAAFHLPCLLLLIAIIFLLDAGKITLASVAIGLIAALQLGRYLFVQYYRKKGAEAIAKLPPLFAFTRLELKEKAQAYPGYEGVDWDKYIPKPAPAVKVERPDFSNMTPDEIQKYVTNGIPPFIHNQRR